MACNTPIIVIKNGRRFERPCRRCMGCRIAKRNYYTMMSRFEVYTYYKKNRGSSFITLTYDDEHLPINGSLDKNESKKFIKRLREHLSRNNWFQREIYAFGLKLSVPDFKYYICGEYGDLDGRPHYHAIIFGVDSAQLKPFLRKTWTKGFFQCEDVSHARIRYVMKYIDKQYNTNTAFYNKDDVKDDYVQPFSTWSRGLGMDYILDNLADVEKYGGINNAGKIVPLSDYLMKKLGLDKIGFKTFFNNLKRDSESQGYSNVREYLLDKRYSDELNFYHSLLLKNSPAWSDFSQCAKNNLESYQDLHKNNSDIENIIDRIYS